MSDDEKTQGVTLLQRCLRWRQTKKTVRVCCQSLMSEEREAAGKNVRKFVSEGFPRAAALTFFSFC